MYDILIESGIPKKPVRLIKVCLNETYSRVRVRKHSSDVFPIRNGLKEGDASSPLLFNFTVQYAIRSVQLHQDGLKLNGTHQLLVDDFFSTGATQPIVGLYFAALYRAIASSRTRFLDHTQRRATVGRSPLDE